MNVQPGDVYRFDAEFRNRSREYADPDSVTLVIESGGTVERRDARRAARGRYYADVTFGTEGPAVVRFEGELDGTELRPQISCLVQAEAPQVVSPARLAMLDDLAAADIPIDHAASDAFVTAAHEELVRQRAQSLRTEHARMQQARPYRSIP